MGRAGEGGLAALLLTVPRKTTTATGYLCAAKLCIHSYSTYNMRLVNRTL